jgi:acyl-CoA thioester hydrolase
MFEYKHQLRVRYIDTDQMGVVYHGHFAHYFEASRVEAIRSLGTSYKEIEAMGILMPVVDISIRFLRPALYDDLLTIHAVLKEFPNNHKMVFHQEVFNEKNELLAKGQVTLYIINAADKTRTQLPKNLLDKFQAFFN